MVALTHSEVRRSFATIAEMFGDRGLDTSSLSSDDASPDRVAELASEGTVFHVDVPSCRARVVYHMPARFKLASVRKLLEREDAGGAVDVVLLVCREMPASSALKGIGEMDADVQIFELRELQYNVSRHALVPRHEPVRDEARIAEVLKLYELDSRYKMPLILSTDAMARYLALKPGQLVRIERPSPSSGTYVMYRCCQRASHSVGAAASGAAARRA